VVGAERQRNWDDVIRYSEREHFISRQQTTQLYDKNTEGSLTSMLNIQFKAKLTSKLSIGQRAATDKLEGLQKIAAITEIVSCLYFLYCQILMCDHTLATGSR